MITTSTDNTVDFVQDNKMNVAKPKHYYKALVQRINDTRQKQRHP